MCFEKNAQRIIKYLIYIILFIISFLRCWLIVGRLSFNCWVFSFSFLRCCFPF
nr:MAG TPA: hypothetical protein [Caudoviricetes sp.]